jgi:hypothetical protein
MTATATTAAALPAGVSGPALRRVIRPGPAAVAATWGVMTLPETRAVDGRIAPAVTAPALTGRVRPRLPESVVALCAALIPVQTGAMPEAKPHAGSGPV